MDRGLAAVAVCSALAALFTWLLVDGLKKGRLELGVSAWAERDRNPVGFWLLAAIYVFLIAANAIGAMIAGLQET